MCSISFYFSAGTFPTRASAPAFPDRTLAVAVDPYAAYTQMGLPPDAWAALSPACLLC